MVLVSVPSFAEEDYSMWEEDFLSQVICVEHMGIKEIDCALFLIVRIHAHRHTSAYQAAHIFFHLRRKSSG